MLVWLGSRVLDLGRHALVVDHFNYDDFAIKVITIEKQEFLADDRKCRVANAMSSYSSSIGASTNESLVPGGTIS